MLAVEAALFGALPGFREGHRDQLGGVRRRVVEQAGLTVAGGRHAWERWPGHGIALTMAAIRDRLACASADNPLPEGRWRSRRLEALDALDALAERTTSASPQSWTRESLHERRSG